MYQTYKSSSRFIIYSQYAIPSLQSLFLKHQVTQPGSFHISFRCHIWPSFWHNSPHGNVAIFQTYPSRTHWPHTQWLQLTQQPTINWWRWRSSLLNPSVTLLLLCRNNFNNIWSTYCHYQTTIIHCIHFKCLQTTWWFSPFTSIQWISHRVSDSTYHICYYTTPLLNNRGLQHPCRWHE